jgi:hypothetical protein
MCELGVETREQMEPESEDARLLSHVVLSRDDVEELST